MAKAIIIILLLTMLVGGYVSYQKYQANVAYQECMAAIDPSTLSTIPGMAEEILCES